MDLRPPPVRSGFRTTVSETKVLLALAVSLNTSINDDLECELDESFEPLFGLLDSLVELAFIFGIGLAVFGFMFAGICYMLPGEEWNRRGKIAAKNTFTGAVILLSAHMVVDFLVERLGGVFC